MANTNSRLLNTYRFVGSIIGLFALVVQLYLIVSKVQPNGPGYLEEVVRYFSYMTIWTNILVAMAFSFPLFFPDSRLNRFLGKAEVEGGLVVYIFIVMLINHFFLAGVVVLVGMQWWVDLLLHYIIPVFYIIYWILFGQKGKQEFGNSVRWLIYPLIYILFVLIRGAISGKYPYPFIDVAQLGYAIALRNMVLIAIAYMIVGLIFIIIDKRLPRTGPVSTS